MLSDSSNNQDVTNNYKIKWYFLKPNNEEYPINELAENVIMNGGKISFIKMKDPAQILIGHGFATNGTHNYTSPTFEVNVGSDGGNTFIYILISLIKEK